MVIISGVIQFPARLIASDIHVVNLPLLAEREQRYTKQCGTHCNPGSHASGPQSAPTLMLFGSTRIVGSSLKVKVERCQVTSITNKLRVLQPFFDVPLELPALFGCQRSRFHRFYPGTRWQSVAAKLGHPESPRRPCNRHKPTASQAKVHVRGRANQRKVENR